MHKNNELNYKWDASAQTHLIERIIRPTEQIHCYKAKDSAKQMKEVALGILALDIYTFYYPSQKNKDKITYNFTVTSF